MLNLLSWVKIFILFKLNRNINRNTKKNVAK